MQFFTLPKRNHVSERICTLAKARKTRP